MAADVFVAAFALVSGQLPDLRGAIGDRPTFTIIAPAHDAMSVTERRRERLGCRDLTEAGFSSATWAMGGALRDRMCGRTWRARGESGWELTPLHNSQCSFCVLDLS